MPLWSQTHEYLLEYNKKILFGSRFMVIGFLKLKTLINFSFRFLLFDIFSHLFQEWCHLAKTLKIMHQQHVLS